MKPLESIMNIIKTFFKNDTKTNLGRWHLNDCHKKINKKIDLSNEDHCGPCGQYNISLKESSNIESSNIQSSNIESSNIEIKKLK